MAERPILFSAPMVLAIRAGSKTQTRRVVKGSPNHVHWNPVAVGGIGGWTDEHGRAIKCPYGQPGDRLWVREAIRLVPDQAPDDGTGPVLSVYAADNSPTVADAWPWKRSYLPPMHCPRGLSRITLEVVSVRAERLQDISEADARAEGCPNECMTPTGDDNGSAIHGPHGYIALWESINGPDSWAANPWVWVLTTKAVPNG